MSRKQRLQKMSHWHEAVVDWMLENPVHSIKDRAEAFEVSYSYMAIICTSDVFKEYFARRRELHNAQVSKTITERAEGVASVALDVLQERIDAERETIGLNTVIETSNMALRALGFGPRNGGRGDSATQVNISFGGASPELLARARSKLAIVNAREGDDAVETLPAPNAA